MARLEWHARSRATVGWYLRRRARRERRLAVDVGLDALALDTLADSLSWRERAQSAVALSTPLALDAADQALRGGLPPAPSAPLAAGEYQLHVTGLDSATLALVCPGMHVMRAGDTAVIEGRLDDPAMRTLIRRLNLLGARVLAIFREHRVRRARF